MAFRDITFVSGLAIAGCASSGQNSTSTPTLLASDAAYHRAAADRKPEDPALVWTPDHVVLVATEIAPDVFAVCPDDAARKSAAGIPAATSGGFVIGSQGVLIIDTMINRRLAEQVLALIRERTTAPILYAVNTSYHGDHSYGNQFLPAATKVIQHESTQKYIQTHFPEDIAFMSQYFGAHSGLQELRPTPAAILLKDGDSRDFDLGGKVVTVKHLGFAQTAGDLFVWIAADKVLFTGNPIISGGPSFSWLLDGHSGDALATLQRLRHEFPDDAIVVPGHGVPSGMAAIDAHIRYLTDLRREVSAAVADGLDQTAASERVSKRLEPSYGSYKIYPWVNTQLNVAKVYDELKRQR
jgi:glyoxylase-like metal-dependent hydrolase (beta-lactamase superfamily II)